MNGSKINHTNAVFNQFLVVFAQRRFENQWAGARLYVVNIQGTHSELRGLACVRRISALLRRPILSQRVEKVD